MTPTRILVAMGFALAAFAQSYDEPFRPQFHFTPRINWTNDPNGLVYFDGEYHLFYQYNPFGDGWGHMSWGHAVSPDLLHWKELPVALAEEDGVMIFTGSTVVDERNSSGFCTGGKPCLVAIYTGHSGKDGSTRLETQNVAFSNDRGRTWTKYKGNPVLDLKLPQFRDPHVFWSKAGNRWVMAVSLPLEHKVLFFGSADLKKWDKLSEFGPAGAASGEWECPTVAELPIDGDPKKTRFVLKIGMNPGALQGGSGEQYFVGTFDGARFTNDNPPATTLWVDSGKDCYCALVFNHAPQPTMLGWMSNWQYAGKTPTSPWRGQMTIARNIGLVSTPAGLRLKQVPAGQLDKMLRARVPVTSLKDFAVFDMEADLTVEPGSDVGFNIHGALVGYDAAKGELYIDRTKAGQTGFHKDFPARTYAKLPLRDGRLRLRILVDRSSIEVFAQDGRLAMTNLFFPSEPGVSFYTAKGAKPKSLTTKVWELK